MPGGQYGEDRILKVFFKGQETGLLVDVGAACGYLGSNSLELLKRPGWKGILIEPEPTQFAKLTERYKDNPNVTLINCAIGPVEGMTTFYCGPAEGRQSSTLKPDFKKRCEKMYGLTYSQIQIAVRNLTNLLSELKLEEDIDFISVDTEGMNYESWSTLDTSKFFPKLVCIEGKGYAMPGYREFCLTRGNTFYLREDICSLL